MVWYNKNFPCDWISPYSDIFLLAAFSTFSNLPTAVAHSSPSYQILIGHRSSLAMPHPTHRSHYSQVIYVVAVANIAVAKSWLPEKRSWHPHPHLEHRTCSSTTCQPRAMRIPIGQWYDGMWYAQCDGLAHSNEGIAFLSFLVAFVMEGLSDPMFWWLMPRHRVRAYPGDP